MSMNQAYRKSMVDSEDVKPGSFADFQATSSSSNSRMCCPMFQREQGQKRKAATCACARNDRDGFFSMFMWCIDTLGRLMMLNFGECFVSRVWASSRSPNFSQSTSSSREVGTEPGEIHNRRADEAPESGRSNKK